MTTAEIWGIAGCIIGMIGGLIGMLNSLWKAQGPRERLYIIKYSIILCVTVGMFLGSLWVLPRPYRQLTWIPYVFFIAWGIPTMNRKWERIRRAEKTEKESQR